MRRRGALIAEFEKYWQRKGGGTYLIVERPGQGALHEVLLAVQWLMCKSEEAGRPCGRCLGCQKVIAHVHPDVHYLIPITASAAKDMASVMGVWRETIMEDPYLLYADWMERLGASGKQGNIAVQQVRTLQEKVRLHASEGSRKVFIIWLAEYLGKEGNILLKTLEEPPPSTYFFLITQRLEAVLPTIRSRSIIYRMQRMDKEEFVKAANQLEVDVELAETLYEVLEGCPGLLRHVTGETWPKALRALQVWRDAVRQNNLLKVWQIAQRMHEYGREGVRSLLEHMLRAVRQYLREGRWKEDEVILFADAIEELIEEVRQNMHIAHAVLTHSLRLMVLFRMPRVRRLIAPSRALLTFAEG